MALLGAVFLTDRGGADREDGRRKKGSKGVGYIVVTGLSVSATVSLK